MSISEALKVEHEYFAPLKEEYDNDLVISIIIDCYFNLDFIKQSVKSVLDQQYNNVELVLINNGAKKEVSQFLKEVYIKAKNTSLIVFNNNQFSWTNKEKPVLICWNVGLNYCKGEIVSHLSYDDLISKNYAEKMTKLFRENPNCMTASPLPISINSNGEVNKDSDYLKLNNRSRFTEGKKVALDYIQGSPKKMFAAPGEILAFKKNILIRNSGFDGYIDISQIIKFAIEGDIGFDPKAFVYWRHHSQQTNRQSSDRGYIDYIATKKYISESKVLEIWREKFSHQHYKLLENFINNEMKMIPIYKLRYMIEKRNFIGLFKVFFNILKECPDRLISAIYFSIKIPAEIIIKKLRNNKI